MYRVLRDPVLLLVMVPVLIWALSFHEFCHGFAAKMLGDPTAERSGRLSLNPFVHFDFVGTLMLLFIGFGWAKPVPINSRYFKNPKRDLIIVSLAGVAGNILTAIVTVLFIKFFGPYWHKFTGIAGALFIAQMIKINMGLAAFNLIPIPPLDGSRILEAFLPYKYMGYYYWCERYGTIILFLLLVTGIINLILNPIIKFLWLLLPY